MRAQVTIREVARLAEVHPSTVSRALNEETRFLVNPDTAARVLRAAAELGYRPNPIARGLKTNRSYTVGVLIPDLTNPLFPPIVRGIEDRLATAGYTALIVNTDNDARGSATRSSGCWRARSTDSSRRPLASTSSRWRRPLPVESRSCSSTAASRTDRYRR